MASTKSSTTVLERGSPVPDGKQLEKEMSVGSVEGGGDDLPELVTRMDKAPKVKNKWTIFDPLNSHHPTPPAFSMDEATDIPLATASFISKLTFWWMTPLLLLGYKRSLVAEDLWKMDESRRAAHLADLFEGHFARRKGEVEEWNRCIDEGTMEITWVRRTWWRTYHQVTGFGSPDGRRTVGMAMALSDTFRWEFWSAGLFKIVGDLAQVCSPLITKQIIYFVTDASAYANSLPGSSNPPVGRGIGLAFALLFLQIIYSVCTAQMFSRSAQVGVLARAALISAVYRRAMVLSGKSRVSISNSKLVNHISTDISRIDFASSFFHFSWTCAFQLLEVIIILIVNIGVSALAGLALVAVALPFQTFAMRKLFLLRRKSMVFTDQRIKLISEILLGVRVVKLFGWEVPFLAKVHQFRKRELVGIRNLLTIRAGNQALAISIPMLASILTFATYTSTGHGVNPAVIWTSLSLLNLLRMPLMMLPNSLSTMTDAHNAMLRLVSVFTCETLDSTFLIEPTLPSAVLVTSANFVWEASSERPSATDSSKPSKSKRPAPSPTTSSIEDITPPSSLSDINFDLPRGSLVMICGPVGSGKSSLLQGLIGEMRKTSGDVTFGGSLSYCAQSPWIQNTSVRGNILFGQPWDEAKYWQCVKDSCLLPDFEQLPHGDMTEIGEKGIALSGGQRQRVSICRTLYYSADIILLDDPMSAIDAHVGKYILDNVILGALASKTRILSTHALHIMSYADHIICMDNGSIVETGTYEALMESNGTFARLSREYGGVRDAALADKVSTEKHEDVELKEEEETINGVPVVGRSIMQAEERIVGSVSGSVYKNYFVAAHGWFTVPVIAIALAFMTASTVLSQFELTWWQDNLFNKPGTGDSFYMGLYAALGLSSALFTFLMGERAVVMGCTASETLHREAIDAVGRAPMRFFDTTPIGRILSRFAKDADNLDNRLNDSLRMSMATFGQITGSFLLVAIVQPYFLIAIAVVMATFYSIASFYSASSVDIKRLDNLLRSSLYAHFSESLAGLSTIRAFGECSRFVKDNENFIDLENRAYFLTVINQRWLAIRLDLLGATLTFIISLLAVGQRYTISPSQIGLILASVLSVQQALSMVVRQGAEVQSNLASVERLQHYGTQLEEEAPAEIAETEPESSWPSEGRIVFKDVAMSYRPELPLVLRGLSLDVHAGEKVGVVGRTGAGKSSVMLTLFRIVELAAGSIHIDGIDISKLGLRTLRQRLSIIPQDALLFNGTLRSNLDPFGVYEDAILWSALKRAWLVDRDVKMESEASASNRFTLDTPIEDEGLNMSVGERSLVSLARALVKDTQIVVLDEATASVDFETDAKIQRTIRDEFKGKTLLCIAHRLSTIIGYDRVLVMDKGTVSAFDTPENLFMGGGIFHGLCLQSGISLEDIRKAKWTAPPASPSP